MQKKIPQRQCMGCRERKEKRQMIRVVRTTEGDVRLDFSGKLNGRGAYICQNEACFRKARKSGILHRTLECEISEEIYAELEKEVRVSEEKNS